MKYIVKQRIDCVLTIPNGTQLEIDGFTFLRDSNGNNSAKYIQTEVDANTEEEAKSKARKLTTQFLSKIAILHDAKYTLLGIISVTDGKTTTVSRDISGRFNLGINGDDVKDGYVKNIKNKRLRVRPLQHYSDAINSIDTFDQFRNYYLVLEYYLEDTRSITNWIKIKESNIEMKKGKSKYSMTVISWIRHKLSHSKKINKGLTPLSISNPKDVSVVQKHLSTVQNLAREIIREHEKI